MNIYIFFSFFRPLDYWKEKGRRKSYGSRLLSKKYVTSFRQPSNYRWVARQKIVSRYLDRQSVDIQIDSQQIPRKIVSRYLEKQSKDTQIYRQQIPRWIASRYLDKQSVDTQIDSQQIPRQIVSRYLDSRQNECPLIYFRNRHSNKLSLKLLVRIPFHDLLCFATLYVVILVHSCFFLRFM